ncbi:hypothetical protein B0T18DRAFT_487591 [Schizothecium vesticola]|uniref:RelA/SpoT domain-containing protein n=1 Tax=Schizothecium vesticola TaxID=314040 RepID=A0AA40K8C4_9PEZI|nr:hypothetical protein B0T18DRAFT_487591 [Schizothecium vesticola]
MASHRPAPAQGDEDTSNQLLQTKINQMTERAVGADPKSAFVSDIWPTLQSEYEIMKKRLMEFCENTLKQEGIACQVTGRTKAVDSVKASLDRREKASQQQLFENLSAIFDEIHDLVGLRIILEFPDDMHRAIAFIKKNFIEKREPTVFLADRDVGQSWKKPWFGAYQTRNYRLSLKDEKCQTLAQFSGVLFEIQLTTIAEDLYNKLAHPILYKGCSEPLTRQDEMVVDLSHGLSLCYALCLMYMKDKLRKNSLKFQNKDELVAATTSFHQAVKGTRFDTLATPEDLAKAVDMPPEAYKSTGGLKEWIDKRISDILTEVRSTSRTIREAVLSKLPVAKGAAFDSYAEEHNERCHPGTRAELLRQIRSWADDPQAESIFWLNGMAGTGKSTISRTVATLFAKEGLLGASFFFKRGEGDRGKAGLVFPTIARQLVHTVPGLVSFVSEAIDADLDLPQKALRDQFGKLILQPLNSVHHTTTIVIVIDALDECDGDKDVGTIIKLLAQSKRQQVVEQDISTYLANELARIKDEYSGRVPKVLEYRTATHNSTLDKLDATYLPVLDQLTSGRTDQDKAEVLAEFRSVVGPIVLLAQPLSVRSLAQLLGVDPEDVHIPGKLRSEVNQQTVDTSLPPEFQYACKYWVHHLKESKNAIELSRFLHDIRRFVMNSRSIIDIAPLQVYASALVFSPARSITRGLFKQEERSWIAVGPVVENDWNACTQTLEGHSSFVSSVTFSPDSKFVVSGSYDSIVKIWDTATGACTQTLAGHNGTVYSVTFSPDSKFVASGSEDNTVRIWDTATGTYTQTLAGHSSNVYSVTFSPDSKFVTSGSEDSTVKIWDTATGACTQTLAEHNGTVYSVTFSPDSKFVTSGSDDNTVRIWDMATGVYTQTLAGHSSIVYSVTFSPDSKFVASGSCDNTVKIWDAATGTCTQTLAEYSSSLDSSKFIASWSGDSKNPYHQDNGIGSDGRWITRGSENWLWLPPGYRPERSAVEASTVAIGCATGRVLIMTFPVEDER